MKPEIPLGGDGRGGGGDRKVLQGNAGPVEERDLIGARATWSEARDHRAKRNDALWGKQPCRHGVLTLADAHGLRHLVGEDAGRCDQRRIEFLLALVSVPIAAIWVPGFT